jgi:tRNA pseudouridine32 synthase/23S rRNA pseudouridine746 synthase
VPEMPPVLFRDERFVVLDKPAGLPVHSGPRRGASAEVWFTHRSRRKDGPWLAHRLDADTAGCLVVALRRAALIEAQAAFAEGRVRKTYWAVVRGAPARTEGTIAAKLRRISTQAGWRMVVDDAGQDAVTDWRLRGHTDDLAWLELLPRTGRTHQVRVHCATLGCPVLGDPVYGGGTGRLHLLARAIVLPLEPQVSAVAEPPGHMQAALHSCGWEPAAR